MSAWISSFNFVRHDTEFRSFELDLHQFKHRNEKASNLEYKLKPLEYNGLKGQIGEQLARSFSRDKLVPKLIEVEEWDHIVLSRNDYKKHGWTWNTKLFNYDYFWEDFIVYGFYANNKLLAKYATAVAILEQNHCTPDGLLLKLRETTRKKKA